MKLRHVMSANNYLIIYYLRKPDVLLGQIIMNSNEMQTVPAEFNNGFVPCLPI